MDLCSKIKSIWSEPYVRSFFEMMSEWRASSVPDVGCGEEVQDDLGEWGVHSGVKCYGQMEMVTSDGMYATTSKYRLIMTLYIEDRTIRIIDKMGWEEDISFCGQRLMTMDGECRHVAGPSSETCSISHIVSESGRDVNLRPWAESMRDVSGAVVRIVGPGGESMGKWILTQVMYCEDGRFGELEFVRYC